MTAPLDGIASLSGLGVIRAQGEDAASFLHGQLTQDFALLGTGQARLAAFCSAKGRMLASFLGFKHAHDEILLVCSRDILAPALKRLSMFVLRAKVKLSDATADFQLLGLAGSAVRSSGAPWTLERVNGVSVIHLYPADGVPRALWVAPAGDAPPEGSGLTGEAWSWGEVRSGIATITSPIVEAFVPQMLNYESVGGVNFKKGCYPGQEVVARSQFRGTLKRRAFVAHADGVVQVGQEVFHGSDREQPVGVVAQAAPHPDGGFDAIVSLQLSATESGVLTVGGPDGVTLTLQPLPYELLADV